MGTADDLECVCDRADRVHALKRPRPNLRSDLWWGLQRSLSIAAILSIAVALRDAVSSSAGSARVGLDTETIIASYLFCALIVGFVVGAARPVIGRPICAAVVGVLAAWPCTFLFELIDASSTEDLIERAKDATILAVIYGIVLSAMLVNSTKKP